LKLGKPERDSHPTIFAPSILEAGLQRAVVAGQRALVEAWEVAPVLEQAEAEEQHVPEVEVEAHTVVVAPEAVEAVADRETSAAAVQHTDHPRLTTRQAGAAVSEV
jgi:hypothetical protein